MWSQESSIQTDRKYWSQLKSLYRKEDWVEFYKLYSEYLEWANVYSENREVLHGAAKKTSNYIKLIKEEVALLRNNI